jgi:predicted 3-demethylubiquinone-9 3-methyltransferase (glyoxalase superfamily)
MNAATQKITPFLWYDAQAEEAVHFYTALFERAKVVDIRRYPEGPLEGPMAGMEGKVLTAVFELAGRQFMALDGGPHFHFTPAVSFFVDCETEAEADRLWSELSGEGSVLMPFQANPFSEKFGWLADKYGLSWQLNLAGSRQKITPLLMFVGEQCGWLKDRFGVSWQIVPAVLPQLLDHPDPEKSQRVMQALLQMKKLDIEGLKQARETVN